MRNTKYKTVTEGTGEYSIKATQKIKEGYGVGSYTYAIFEGRHLIDIGNVSCQRFSTIGIEEDVKATLVNYVKRYVEL